MFKRLSSYRKTSHESSPSRSGTRSPETAASRSSQSFRWFETTRAEDANAGYENVAATSSHYSVTSNQSSASLQPQENPPKYETVDAEDYKRHNNAKTVENSARALTHAEGTSATAPHESASVELVTKSQNEELDTSLSSLSVQETQEARAATSSPIKSPTGTINEKLSAFYVNKAKICADESKWTEALEMLKHAEDYGFEGVKSLREEIFERQRSKEWMAVENEIKAMNFLSASDTLRRLLAADYEKNYQKFLDIYTYNIDIERRALQAQVMDHLHKIPDLKPEQYKPLWTILSVLRDLTDIAPLANLGKNSSDDVVVEAGREFLRSHISTDCWEKGVAAADQRRDLRAQGAKILLESYDDVIAETLGLARDYGASLINDGKRDDALRVLEVVVEALVLEGEFGLSQIKPEDLVYPVDYTIFVLPMEFPDPPLNLSRKHRMDAHYSKCPTCHGPARRLIKLLDSIYETQASISDLRRTHTSSAMIYFKMRELRSRTAGIYRDSDQDQQRWEINYRLLEATAHLRSLKWMNAQLLLTKAIPHEDIEPGPWEKGMMDLRAAQLWFWRDDKLQDFKLAASRCERAVHTLGSITPEPMQLYEAVALTVEIYRLEGISHKSEAYQSLLPDGADTMLYGSIVLQPKTRSFLKDFGIGLDPVTLTPNYPGLVYLSEFENILHTAIRSDNEEVLTILLEADLVGRFNESPITVYDALMAALRRESSLTLLLKAGFSLDLPARVYLFLANSMAYIEKTMLSLILDKNWVPSESLYILLLAMDKDRRDVCQMLTNKHQYQISDLNADISIREYRKRFELEWDSFQPILKQFQLPLTSLPSDNITCIQDSENKMNYTYPTRIIEYAILKGERFLPLVEELLAKGAIIPSRFDSLYTPAGWATMCGGPKFAEMVTDIITRYKPLPAADEAKVQPKKSNKGIIRSGSTRVSSYEISRSALVEKNFHFESSKGAFDIKGVLSEREITDLKERTKELRKERADRDANVRATRMNESRRQAQVEGPDRLSLSSRLSVEGTSKSSAGTTKKSNTSLTRLGDVLREQSKGDK